MKKKQIIITLTILLFILIFLYIGGYIYHRKKLNLVHKKSWTQGNNIHKIEKGYIDSKAVLITVLLNGGNETEAEFVIQKVERKINRLYYFYYPCIIGEEIIWNQVD